MSGIVSLSPLVLRQLIFGKVSIEPYEFEGDKPVWAPAYDFEGVEINTSMTKSTKESDEGSSVDYLVRLRLEIPNVSGEKKSPYTVDVEAQALFQAPSTFAKEKSDEIDGNCPSFIVGAIREMVTQITSRSIYGPMTIPALCFHPASDE